MGISLRPPPVDRGTPPLVSGALIVGITLLVFYPFTILIRLLLQASHGGGRALASAATSPRGLFLGSYRVPSWIFGVREIRR